MNNSKPVTRYIQQIARSIFPGILLCVLGSCKNDMKEINSLVAPSNLQEDRATDVVFIYSEGSKVKARLFSKEFARNESAKPPYTDFKKGIKVEFYNDSLGVESVLTAKYARYYEQQNNVLIRDSVQIINKKGERLNTRELVWNQTAQKFYTQKPVSITTASQTFYGDGMEANQDFTWYRILNMRGTMQVEKDKMPQ